MRSEKSRGIGLALKVAAVIIGASLLGGATTVIDHSVRIAVVENDAQYIKQKLDAIDEKLDKALTKER